MEAIEFTAKELTVEHLKELRRMRKDTQMEIAVLRQQHVEHPERRHATANLYAKLTQLVIKLITMEQQLLAKLEEDATAMPVTKAKRSNAPAFPYRAAPDGDHVKERQTQGFLANCKTGTSLEMQLFESFAAAAA